MRFYSSWQEIQTQSWVRSETTFIWGQRYIIMQKRRKSLVWKDSPEVRKQRWANENKLKISRFESCWDVIEFKVFRHSVSVIIFFERHSKLVVCNLIFLIIIVCVTSEPKDRWRCWRGCFDLFQGGKWEKYPQLRLLLFQKWILRVLRNYEFSPRGRRLYLAQFSLMRDLI